MLLRTSHQWWRKMPSSAPKVLFGSPAIAAYSNAITVTSGPIEQWMIHRYVQLSGQQREIVEVPELNSYRVQPDTSLADRHFLSHILNFSHFTFQQTFRMRGLSSHVPHSIDPTGIIGTYVSRLLYWAFHIYVQVRNPSEMDWILGFPFSSVEMVIVFPTGSCRLCLDFDDKHSWKERNTYGTTWSLYMLFK